MESSFPTARCERCDKTVLTHVVLDELGEEQRRCVHCDSPVAGALNWVEAEELQTQGYYVRGETGGRVEPGCGTGCCASSIREKTSVPDSARRGGRCRGDDQETIH